MLLQVIAKFDPMQVNVKDIAKGLEDAGIDPSDMKVTTAREPQVRAKKGGRKPAEPKDAA